MPTCCRASSTQGGPAYATRIKSVGLRGLPEPVRQAVQALVGLVSAGAMSDATGIDFEKFSGRSRGIDAA